MSSERRDPNQHRREVFITTAKSELDRACHYLNYLIQNANRVITVFRADVKRFEALLEQASKPKEITAWQIAVARRIQVLEQLRLRKLNEIKDFKRKKFQDLSAAQIHKAKELGMTIPSEIDVNNSLLQAEVVFDGDLITLGTHKDVKHESPQKRVIPAVPAEPDEMDRIINEELNEFGRKRGLSPKDLAGDLDKKYREWLKEKENKPDEPKPES